MSPHLPVEILRLIIDNFKLPDFSSSRRTFALETETRHVLYTLCLTSRTFRQIAAPLLLRTVRIFNSRQFSRLFVNNTSNDRLKLIKTLIFNEEWDFDPYSVKSFILRSVVERLICNHGSPYLRIFSGSTLKRLFLNSQDLHVRGISTATFPSVEILGFSETSTESGTELARCFPSVRHLIYGRAMALDDQNVAFLTCLAPQLRSFGLLASHFRRFREAVPSLRAHSILVHLPLIWATKFSREGSQAVNLRLVIFNRHSVDLRDCCREISATASRLDTQFPQLRSIYLPPLDSLPDEYHTDDFLESFEGLLVACQKLSIDVIYEEQSDKLQAECQVSEEFIRRKTEERIKEEAGEVPGSEE